MESPMTSRGSNRWAAASGRGQQMAMAPQYRYYRGQLAAQMGKWDFKVVCRCDHHCMGVVIVVQIIR